MSSRRKPVLPKQDPVVNKLVADIKKLGLTNAYAQEKVKEYKNSYAINKSENSELIKKILEKAEKDRNSAIKRKEAKRQKSSQMKKNAGKKTDASKYNRMTKLQTHISNLRNASSRKNNTSRGGYAFLSNLYRAHGNGRMNIKRFDNILKTDDNKINNYIKKQHNILTKNTAIVSSNKTTFTFEMDTELLHDLLFMIYLDMRHDGLFNGGFKSFLSSDIVKKDLLKNPTAVPSFNIESNLI